MKKQPNYSWKWYRDSFVHWPFLNYSFLILSLLLVIGLMIFLYLKYNDGIDVSYNQVIQFGFYNLKLLPDKNEISLNGFSIMFSVLIIVNTALCCYTYWIYRNSEYKLYTKRYTIMFLYILIILFLLFLLSLNFMNRDVINLRNKDIINNGYWDDIVNNNIEVLNFNYTYDVILAKYSANNYVVEWRLNQFGILWIVISSMAFVSIFISYLVMEYFKNKYLGGLVHDR